MSDQLEGLAEVVATLNAGLGDDLVAVVLFGSRARGEAGEASDWDLFVIARRLPDKAFPRYQLLKGMLPVAWRGRTAILAKTCAEFETHLSSLFLDIAVDGVILHDPTGYMTRHLAGLKRLLEERELRRERVQNDLVWRWERFPGFGWKLEWEAAQ